MTGSKRCRQDRMNRERLRLIKKLSSFLVSNLFGTAVDTLVLWICSDYIFDTYAGEYLISPVISFECSVFVNFLCSYLYIWKDRISKRSFTSFWRHYGPYNLSASGVFLLKMGLLLIIERIFKWDVVFCNLLALCVSGSINYAMGEWVIFRKKKKSR